MGMCVAAFQSMTYAMKGQRLLAANVISSQVIKLESSQTQNGCAYGVQFDCYQYNNVRNLFSRGNIHVREYINGGLFR